MHFYWHGAVKLTFPQSSLYACCYSAQAWSSCTQSSTFPSIESVCLRRCVWIYTHEIISSEMREQEKDLLRINAKSKLWKSSAAFFNVKVVVNLYCISQWIDEKFNLNINCCVQTAWLVVHYEGFSDFYHLVSPPFCLTLGAYLSLLWDFLLYFGVYSPPVTYFNYKLLLIYNYY